MSAPLIFIIAPQDEGRAALLRVVETDCDARAMCFDQISAARAAMDEPIEAPALIIAPWCDEADSALGLQRDIRQQLAQSAPYMLILTHNVSPTKISLAARVGRAELIPNAPLDTAALSNRITLLLWGAKAMGEKLWGKGLSGAATAA